MSCEFLLTATFEGINKFIDEEKSIGSQNENEASRNTLSNFKIALSSTGEIIVFTKKTWLLICGSKWDLSTADSSKIKYSPNWHGHVKCKQGEEITSVVCLPYLFQGQSIQINADWTCIVVGFSSGCVRFYTEAMQELACSFLHEEPISQIKFGWSSTQPHKAQKQENPDLHILYKTVLCVVNGTLLTQILSNLRYELAKNNSVKSVDDDYTPLEFKKYSFSEQEEINDACFLGQANWSFLSTFDHLVNTSVINGFYSNYRTSPPQTSLIVTSGRRPFVGFHYTLEGSSGPLLSDVALAVASKIKNNIAATLPGWLGFGSKKSTNSDKPKEVAQDVAEKLNLRFGLSDFRREGQSIIVSPDGTFSAVADSLGRIALVNNNTGIAQKLWKGYREAQCGFIQVREDIPKSQRKKELRRQGLFIVIYAPKKGLIEIFSTQHGRRVSSFNVSKFGKLLYTPKYLNSNICTNSSSFSRHHVVFISEEGLREFNIPFHCALEEDNSKLSRDLHVLKKLKLQLKMENYSSISECVGEIEKCARELKTYEVKLQTIEYLVSYKNTTLEAFKTVLEVILEDAKKKDEEDLSSRKIVAFAETIFNLLSLYEFLLEMNTHPESSSSKSSEEALADELILPKKELDYMLEFINQVKEIEGIKKQNAKVSFEEKKSTKLGMYLACYDFDNFLNQLERFEKLEEEKVNPVCCLNLKSSCKDKFGYLGEIFFKGIFHSISSLDQWKAHAESCYLNPIDLAFCLLSYWCNKNMFDDFSNEINCLVKILKVLCSLNDQNVVSLEYNEESPWWSKLRSFIAGCPSTIPGLMAALCCRSVTIFLEQERELTLKRIADKKLEPEESFAVNSDWENLSKDSCQWDILITQLQDIALLNAILSLNFKNKNEEEEDDAKIDFKFQHECLNSIQVKGTGRVSELVAKWIIQFDLDVETLIDKNDLEFKVQKEKDEYEIGKWHLGEEFEKANKARASDPNVNLALDYLALLKSRFPYSLTSSSLLANMCWEYVAHWNKNMKKINYLQLAVKCVHAIPSSQIKYGVAYMTWNLYLQRKFESLSKMMNALGKVPRNKLYNQEINLRSDQISLFIELVSEYLKIMLHSGVIEDKQDFKTNREAVWQSGTIGANSSLVSIALFQPQVNADLVIFQLQISYCLLIMSGLNIKQVKLFSTLFENVEQSDFNLTQKTTVTSHHHSLKLKSSRTEFLRKCLTAAVQTIQLVESIPPISSDETTENVPSTRWEVEEYKKWLQLCFDLAGAWTVSLEDLRRHQICELYSCGFDLLAEEVIFSVNETAILGSQLLVLGGKRLKYLIHELKDLSKKLANLSPNLSEWLQTLDLNNYKYYTVTFDEIEVMMSYVIKWLPEGDPDQKKAIEIVESLSFLKQEES